MDNLDSQGMPCDAFLGLVRKAMDSLYQSLFLILIDESCFLCSSIPILSYVLNVRKKL